MPSLVRPRESIIKHPSSIENTAAVLLSEHHFKEAENIEKIRKS